jgi:hypothetical protein
VIGNGCHHVVRKNQPPPRIREIFSAEFSTMGVQAQTIVGACEHTSAGAIEKVSEDTDEDQDGDDDRDYTDYTEGGHD